MNNRAIRQWIDCELKEQKYQPAWVRKININNRAPALYCIGAYSSRTGSFAYFPGVLGNNF